MIIRSFTRIPYIYSRFSRYTRYTCTPPTSRMASTLPRLPVFEAISKHDPKSVAVVHSDSGRSFTYEELLTDVAQSKHKLLSTADGQSIAGERIAFLVENGYDYVGAHVRRRICFNGVFGNH